MWKDIMYYGIEFWEIIYHDWYRFLVTWVSEWLTIGFRVRVKWNDITYLNPLLRLMPYEILLSRPWMQHTVKLSPKGQESDSGRSGCGANLISLDIWHHFTSLSSSHFIINLVDATRQIIVRRCQLLKNSKLTWQTAEFTLMVFLTTRKESGE